MPDCQEVEHPGEGRGVRAFQSEADAEDVGDVGAPSWRPVTWGAGMDRPHLLQEAPGRDEGGRGCHRPEVG